MSYLPSQTDSVKGVNMLRLDQSDVTSHISLSPAGPLSDRSSDIWHRNPSVHRFFFVCLFSSETAESPAIRRLVGQFPATAAYVAKCF